MNSMTEYLKNKVLQDNLLDEDIRVGLFNGKNELNISNYKRKSIYFLPPQKGQVTNKEDVLFDIAEGDWGLVTHIGLFDTEGNLLFYEEAEFEKNIEVSDQYKIPKNYLIVRLR